MEAKIKKSCPYQALNPRSPAYSLVTILHYLATHCLREMALINYKQI
jgi:hypothetical protein